MEGEDSWIISLNGKRGFPNENIDTEFLKGFTNFLCDRVNLGERFVVVVGGGGIKRCYELHYEKAVKEYSDVSERGQCSCLEKDGNFFKDKIAVQSSRLNASFLYSLICSQNIPNVVYAQDPFFERFKGYNILVLGGIGINGADVVAVDFFIRSQCKKDYVIGLTSLFSQNAIVRAKRSKVNVEVVDSIDSLERLIKS